MASSTFFLKSEIIYKEIWMLENVPWCFTEGFANVGLLPDGKFTSNVA